MPEIELDWRRTLAMAGYDSERHLCREAHIGTSWLSDLRAGRTKSPGVDKVLAVARTLQLTVEDVITLLGGGTVRVSPETVAAWRHASEQRKLAASGVE